ncbi:MAG TPA: hypothetical protein VFS00_26010 [Polyangiaceae bacterium]|nr:hypothetical protein [Polyangiaceae bacterium]
MKCPTSLRLPGAALARGVSVHALLKHVLGVSHAVAWNFAEHFAFKNDEARFAKELVRRRGNFWVYRTHQARFCGDFVLVDMSSPRPATRRVYVLDLKLGGRLKVGGGGAGVQFRNAALAVAEIAQGGVVDPSTPYELVSGHRDAVLDALGAGALEALAARAR